MTLYEQILFNLKISDNRFSIMVSFYVSIQVIEKYVVLNELSDLRKHVMKHVAKSPVRETQFLVI